MKLTVVTTTGKNSSLTVSDSVFADKPNEVLVAQAVRVYRSNLRQGTSKVKTRSDVKRTKKKWYKQKGTGNARHGARSAHIFIGGGVAHGPKGIENWNRKLSRKMKQVAMRSVLGMQAENVLVADQILQLNGKTSDASKLLNKMVGEKCKILVVLPEYNPVLVRGMRNLENVLIVTASRLNILQVAMADKIIMTKTVLKVLEERLISKKVVVPAKTVVSPKVATPAKKTASTKIKTKETAKSTKKVKKETKKA